MWCRLLALMLITASVWAEPLDKVVAVVNEQVITQTELDAEVEQFRLQWRAKPEALPPEALLRKQVLQHLIDVDLQLQLAKNNDISVDNTELDETIQGIAARNHLTLTQLREALEHQGIVFETYRDNIRKEMLMQRIQQRAVGKDIVVSTEQVDDYFKTMRHNQKEQSLFHVQNIVIGLPDAPTPAQLKKAEQRAQILLEKIKKGADFSQLALVEMRGSEALEGGDLGERHLAELPDIFAKRLIDMEVGEVAGPIRTGNGLQLIKLVALTEQVEHHEVVKTHVRHILLKPDVNMTAAEAETQIQHLYQQLKSGQPFAEMAKKYSLDVASALKGGDLGWVVPEELVKEFSEAMNQLPLHTVSQPIKTSFGWHLIEVLERKTVDDSTAYKRQQLRQQLEQRKLGEAVQSWRQHIRADAYIQILDKQLA